MLVMEVVAVSVTTPVAGLDTAPIAMVSNYAVCVPGLYSTVGWSLVDSTRGSR